MVKFVSLAVLALGLLPGGAAVAQDVAIRVEYRDLNLKDPAGLARLDHRIAQAVSTLCPDGPRADLSGRLEERRCRAATLAQVAPQRERVLAGGLAQQAPIALK